jgi:uncharacterized protein YecT (DUF1311 family)
LARFRLSLRYPVLALGTTLLVGLPGPGLADPALECPTGTQVELSECLAATEAAVERAVAMALELAHAAADELDRTTGRVVAAPALERAQAAWSAYRDAQCDYVGATYGGGSGSGQAIRACRIELGRARVDALMRRL